MTLRAGGTARRDSYAESIPARTKRLIPGQAEYKLRKADDPLLLALACGLSAEQAAKQAGVSVTTAYRRLDDASFAARLDDLRRDMLARAAAMLTAAAVESVRTLADLLKPANAPATRLNAARAILEHGVKLRALVEV